MLLRWAGVCEALLAREPLGEEVAPIVIQGLSYFVACILPF